MGNQNQKLEEVVRYFNEKLALLVDADPEIEIRRNVSSPISVNFCLDNTYSPNVIVEIGFRYSLDQHNRSSRNEFEKMPTSLNEALSPIEAELYAEGYFRGDDTASGDSQIFSCKFRGDKVVSRFVNHSNPIAKTYFEDIEKLVRGTDIRNAIDLAFQMYTDTSIELEGDK